LFNPQSIMFFIITSLSVLIVVMIFLIFSLHHKKKNLQQKIEKQKLELEKIRENLSDLLNGTTVEIKEREFELLNRLISVLEYRDIETANHINRMSNYSRLIAKKIYPEDSPMVSLIFLAATLHDIGKIGISDEILSKPGKLDEEEFIRMKQHPLIGYNILKDSASEVIQLAAVIALTHHERYDGSGYPMSLKGEEIPIAGRIVAVADYFDALVSKRVYKDAWSIERVLDMLKECSGTIFDPICLDAFFTNLGEILAIKDKYPVLGQSVERDIEEVELENEQIIFPEKQDRKIYPRSGR
jgi:response regulator RpfG family c-di-GMP phosphodiesterase